MSDTIENLIQAALNKDYNAASDFFGDAMGEKMTDALEQEKIAIANRIYNDGEPEDLDDDEDIEIDDEDLDFDEDEDDENLDNEDE